MKCPQNLNFSTFVRILLFLLIYMHFALPLQTIEGVSEQKKNRACLNVFFVQLIVQKHNKKKTNKFSKLYPGSLLKLVCFGQNVVTFISNSIKDTTLLNLPYLHWFVFGFTRLLLRWFELFPDFILVYFLRFVRFYMYEWFCQRIWRRSIDMIRHRHRGWGP